MPSRGEAPEIRRACAIVLLAVAAGMIANPGMVSPASTQEAAISGEAIGRALEAVRADPQLNAEKTMKTLRWRDAREPARTERSGWLGWIAALFVWLGQSGRYVVWVAALILAVFAARYVFETGMSARVARAENEPLVAPTHVRDLDIRPASLPPDIGAAARALWDAGQQRAALALLYRGLLSRLAHLHSVPITDSTTEGDCLALAAEHLAPPRHDYVSRLLRVWQRGVYGHEEVSAVAVHELCDGFATALDRAADPASLGKASV